MLRWTSRSAHTGTPWRTVASCAVIGAVLAVAACSSSTAKSSSTTAAGGSTTTKGTSSSQLLGPLDKATGDPIKIGIISDGKSDTNDISIEGRVATATEKFLNDHKKGIAGRPVQIFECDDELDPAKATDCGNQMVEQKVAVVVIGQSAVVENSWQAVHAAGLPVMLYSANGSDILADGQTTFVLADPIASAVNVPLAVAKQAKTKKVAAIVIDVPEATDLFKTLAPPLFKKAGIQLQLIPVPLGTADVTPQLQSLTTDGTGEAFVVGNDALCISVFNGLRSVGFTGKIAAVAQCVTNTTRQAVPGDELKGMVISAQAPVGVNDPSMDLYEAVAKTYGSNIALDDARGAGMFTVLMALHSALQNATGDLTPQAITAAIKAAPKATLEASGGLTFQCNGKADPASPAVCSAGVLTATLDDQGNPVSYKASQPTS